MSENLPVRQGEMDTERCYGLKNKMVPPSTVSSEKLTGIYVRKTNNMHLYLNNLFLLNYPLHVIDILIYLLTAIGLSPGGSSTVHIYTQIIHRTIQNKQYIEQHNKPVHHQQVISADAAYSITRASMRRLTAKKIHYQDPVPIVSC